VTIDNDGINKEKRLSDDVGYADRQPTMMMVTPKNGSTTNKDQGNNEVG
jgi:hypothetical protein